MADVRIKYKVDKGELVIARKELEKINRELGVGEKQTNKLSGALKGVGGVLVAAFTVDKLIDFGRQVIAITAEFDKLRAVLTNTLGSKSQADAAFTRLQEFASKTPFQVSQLTASFVKLANQGFVPTNRELTKLGDLAASTGKDFDQLTEAIIDAQTGEFERLKEFGIRASKQGDQVTFAFKGVETQTKFTSDSIRDYILSLGDLEGVSGSMAAVSKTLGGQISNLQDNFDSLFYALGQASGGIISDVLSALNAAVETVARLVNAANGITGQASIELNKLNEEFGKLETTEQYEAAIETVRLRIEALKGSISENVTQAELLRATQSDATNAFDQQGVILDTLSNEYTDFTKKQNALFEELKATGEATDNVSVANADAKKSFADANTEIVDQSIKLASLEQFLQSLQQGYSKLTDSAGKQIKTWQVESKTLDDLEKRYEALKKIFTDVLDQTQKFGSGVKDLTEENVKLNTKLIEQNEITKRAAELQKDLEKAERESLERRRAQYEAFFEIVGSLNNEIFLRISQNLDDEVASIRANSEEKITALEEERDRKLEVVGNDAEARKAIERQFQQDKAKIDEEISKNEREIAIKQARFDKLDSLFQIAINTAEGITKAVAASPLTGGLPWSAVVAAIGATQAGLVATRPIPKFAEGVINLKGGVKGKDSVPSLLMPGESVMTTAETRDFMPTLKAIRENRIDPEVLNAVANGKGAGVQVHNSVVEVPRDTVIWNEDGFSYYMNRKNAIVQRKGVRYKC